MASGRRRLGWLLLCVPVAMAAGALVFVVLRFPLSRLHPRVQVAERVWLEEKGEAEGETDASKAFRRTGQPPAELYAEALAIRGRIASVGGAVGALVGLVVALRLIGLSVRRSRTDYEADRATCLACGRCFDYCPVGRQRRKGATDG